MRLIKLNATSSTNDFLKELSNSQMLENFTVVSAEMQTAGRGQMGAKWQSESGKNLMMSVLVKEALSDISQIYNLNIVVAIAVIAALKKFDIPDLSIKWPNDIMSGNKKVGGILIENTIRSHGEIISVAGIGLNVNQTDFSNLPKAASLATITNASFDKDHILSEIVRNLEEMIPMLQKKSAELWQTYISNLFKKGIPMAFEDKHGQRFMGIIQGVTAMGKLELMNEQEQVQTFEIKEIQMLY